MNLQAILNQSPSLTKEQQQLAVTSAAAIAAVYLLFSYAKKKQYALPEPESTLPLLGNTLDAMKYQKHRLLDWMVEQSMLVEGKPWQFTVVGRPRNIVVTSPELFEDVLKHHASIFYKGEETGSLIRDIFGRGILAVDGDEWFYQRKTASHLFSLQMMKDVMHDVVKEKILIFYDNLAYYAKSNREISWNRELSHFTSDVFAKIGFGVDLQCMESGRDGPLQNDFVSAFAYNAKIIQLRRQQPRWLWRLKRLLNVGDEAENKRCLEVVNKLIFTIISESMTNKSNSDAPKSKKKDLISLFLDSNINQDSNSKPKNFDQEMHLIRDMIISFIFAGKDTTSQSMTWLIVMMNRYPDVLVKLRTELREKLPKLYNKKEGEKIEIPSLDDLKKLTYLEAVIRENLRLNPPLPISQREAIESVVLSDGTVVPKGTRVMLPQYVQARQPTVWGADASEFKPERWLDPVTGELISVSPFKFSAFLAGPRTCIGAKFAMLEMKIALAVMLTQFDIQTVENPFDITFQASLMLAVKGPMMVRVIPLGVS